MGKKINIGIVGFGHMGQAFAKALAVNIRFKVFAYDNVPGKKRILSKTRKIKGVSTIQDLANSSDIIILAIKPQNFANFFQSNREYLLNKNKLIISIAAGIPLKKIQEYLPKVRIIRAMPNLAAIVKESITFICAGKYSHKGDLRLTETIFSQVGDVVIINEKAFDAITAISGSGPGYIFYFMDSIYKIALKMGFSQKIAKRMVIQTFSGAVKLAKDSNKDFTRLVQEVASKRGTTEAAINVFKRHRFSDFLAEGINKAYQRSKEISRQY